MHPVILCDVPARDLIFGGMRLIILATVLLTLPLVIMARQPDFAVFDAKGNSASLEDIVKRLESVDVLFLGESHDDSVGHRTQFSLLKQTYDEYSGRRRIALSLEMFERDVQATLDEYLNGLISEKQFLEATRPWGNYKTDYRPLVEFAREQNLVVIAANAPRRYVNMVSRLGRDSLHRLPPQSRQWIAPLPYGEPSEAYLAKFNALMASMSDNAAPSAHNPMIHSQALWDATMAYSISEFLWAKENALVVHLNGSFHTEKRLGTPEHLVRYKAGTRYVVVTMRYEKDFRRFDPAEHADLGDFVILTDAAAPRSKR